MVYLEYGAILVKPGIKPTQFHSLYVQRHFYHHTSDLIILVSSVISRLCGKNRSERDSIIEKNEHLSYYAVFTAFRPESMWEDRDRKNVQALKSNMGVSLSQSIYCVNAICMEMYEISMFIK